MKVSVEQIEVHTEELRRLVERAREAPLEEAGCRKLTALIDTFEYVTQLLENKQTTIHALRRLLLQPSTEKTAKVLRKAGIEPGEKKSQPSGGRMPESKAKGHGRNGAESYKAAQKVEVSHPSLKPGNPCPECQEGKVYAQREPRLLVRVVGQAPLHATVYQMERLRCNLCGEVFTAEAPDGVGTKKYDETSASMIALLQYGSGFPFYRLEGLQENLEIPLPAATQWEIVAEAATLIQPAMDELIRQAAQGKVLHNDDTSMKVLGLMKEVAAERDSSDPPERTGVFTSGIVSTTDGQKIALFFTGRKHAGENLFTVLACRAAELGPPIQMCDALSRNLPKPLQVILGYCLAHSRRRFVEVAPNFPSECRYVLEALGAIYHHDELARERGMTPEARLRFHQVHSGPVMEQLHVWLTAQLEEKKVEPNSGLGQAITYMRKHWEKLTLFLRQAGAPLDNNLCERALKKAILHRKNSLFYKTRNGARVGDLYMSLIHTAELCRVNPFDYVTELQRHAADLKRNPRDWMPWNYRQTMEGTGAAGLAA